MSYVKTINEDGVVSDIMAKALDPTLDATILKNSNLVNGFTQTTAGVNALDAAAGKTLNDSLANLSTDVSTNYATKTNLANGYVPQTDSIEYAGWQGVYPCRMDSTNVDIIIPCSSLKAGTLSVNGNTTWNYAVIVSTTGYPNTIITSHTLNVTSIIRINRDLLLLRGAKPSSLADSTAYGVAVNRGAFRISST